MTTTQDFPKVSSLDEVQHPLEPLTAKEIAASVAIICNQVKQIKHLRFVTVALNEPPKSAVTSFKKGTAFNREAFVILLDNSTGVLAEVVVSLTNKNIAAWKEIADVQPSIMLDEFVECEAAGKASPEFLAAIKKRGIIDPELVIVAPWSAGNFGIKEEAGQRIVRALCWVRSSPNDNGYARPIEGVIPVGDLNKMAVLAVEDYGVVPLPPQPGNYSREFITDYRKDLKLLDIIQPDGASFQVEGHKISW